MEKFSIKTFGCKVNQYESELISQNLSRFSYEKTTFPNGNIIIVNACSVTQRTESKVRNSIRKAFKNNPDKIILCGCISPTLENDLKKEFPHLTILKNTDKITSVIKNISKKSPTLKIITSTFKAKTRAFVKIQEGCKSFCSYCIIPFLRKDMYSRNPNDILTEIKNLEHNECKEVVLTGTHIGKYSYEDFKLHNLVEHILNNTKTIRIRLSSIEPMEISEKLINLFANERLCPHLHIPLQSASNKILKKMNRHYTYSEFKSVISNLYKKINNLTTTTDIIVGFPEETDSDFKSTYNSLSELKFIKIHIFPFSPRPYTKAFEFKQKINNKIIKQRKNLLEKLAQKSTLNAKKNFIGKTATILIEKKINNTDNIYEGFSENYLKVQVPSKKCIKNKLINVRLENLNKDGIFIGKIIKQ